MVRRYLDAFGEAICRLLGETLPRIETDWWSRRVLDRLTFQQQSFVRSSGTATLDGLDVAALMRVLDQNWHEIAPLRNLPPIARTWLKETQTIRNRWAHAPASGLPPDETYRDLSFAGAPPLATHLGAHVLSVASLSKAYGLPGLRLGWLLTRDATLATTFLAAKEQVMIGGPVLDEEIGWQVYRRRADLLPGIVAGARRGLATVAAWIAGEPAMEWVAPEGGVVCFPRIRAGAGVDVEGFHRTLMGDYKTFTGPGHWFESDRAHMRLGFGWPSKDELTRGLANITQALNAAKD